MQVKKFEARTMKEALEMVKTQLGPDAIILSARDNNRSFGLVGEGSVEITAAVSEETLQKKKFAESRLGDNDRERFARASARTQKELIEKMVTKHVARNQQQQSTPITQRRYIDIEDDHLNHVTQAPTVNAAEERIRSAAQRALSPMQDHGSEFFKKPAPAPTAAQSMIARVAAKIVPQSQPSAQQQARHQSQAQQPQTQQMTYQQAQYQANAQALNAQNNGAQNFAPQKAQESDEVRNLRNEIASLKHVITQFQAVPQTFAGTHPGADYGLNYDLSFMFEKLTQTGIAPDIAGEILNTAQETIPAMKIKNRSLVEGWVARHLLDTTNVVSDTRQTKVHCFVGPAGAGKTSSMIKLASQLVVREGKKIALLTTDTYKVGAVDQMRIYAQILNVPFSVLRGQNDWAQIMRYIQNLDAVLVDFTGLSLKSPEEIGMLKGLLPPTGVPSKTHLVLPATAKDQDAQELGRRYSVLGYSDVIFTGLDESTQHGTIYNFMRRQNVPLHSFGIGSRVPEDYEFATKERVLDLIFKITKVNEQDKAV